MLQARPHGCRVRAAVCAASAARDGADAAVTAAAPKAVTDRLTAWSATDGPRAGAPGARIRPPGRPPARDAPWNTAEAPAIMGLPVGFPEEW